MILVWIHTYCLRYYFLAVQMQLGAINRTPKKEWEIIGLNVRYFENAASQLSNGSIIGHNIPDANKFIIVIIIHYSYDYLHMSCTNF